MKAYGKPAVSRADLVRLCTAFDGANLDKACTFTGYRRVKPQKMTVQTVPAEKKIQDDKTETDSRKAHVFPDDKTSIPFWHPFSFIEVERKTHQGREPDWYVQADAFEDNEIRADDSLRPPELQPLCPWSKIWPFIRSALGAEHLRGAIDLRQVVRLSAEIKPIKRLPRELRRGWSRRCTLLIDVDSRLIPFWQDMRRLCHNLTRVRGDSGLDLFLLEQGPFGPMRCPNNAVRTVSAFKLPEPGTPILIISDLGLFDNSESVVNSWLRFGKKLKRADFFPVVLTPAPRRIWPDTLATVFRMACWDRGKRFPKLSGPGSRGGRPLAHDEGRQGTHALMSLLSPAIRVEPELLRSIRLLLPADVADAGHEAAVWNHEHVRPGYTGFSFDPQIIAKFREAFSNNRQTDLKQRACELIHAHHRNLSPAVFHEEKLIAGMLMQGQPPKDAEQFFRRTVKTHSQPNFRERAGLNAWMQRVVQRQDPRMWQSEALSATWAKVNHDNWTRGKIGLPHGLDPERIIWVLAKEGPAETYTLFRRGSHFTAEKRFRTEASDREIYSSGSPVIDLISSNGVLRVRETGGERKLEYAVNLRNREPVGFEVPVSGQLQLITSHNEITLKSMQKPSWAEGWGRDEQGLFVILPHGEQTRKAFWFAPGRYSVGSNARTMRLDAVSDTGVLDGGAVIEINQGFWWDQQEFGHQLQNGFQKPEWAHDLGVDGYGIYAEFHARSVVQRMRLIMPGAFLMGSPETESERLDFEQQHKVIHTRGFWLADTACSQALWQAVMGDNPSEFKGDDRPVDNVSWDDCQSFIEKINGAIPGLGLHLPTEAQWEYACRAGTTSPFHFGNNITTDQVNFDGNYPYNKSAKGEYRHQTVPVKTFACNDWGLYEMHGNVWEWCADWYGEYPVSAAVDPLGPHEGENRVLRGGSWYGVGRVVRSAAAAGSSLPTATTASAFVLPEVRQQASRPAEPDPVKRFIKKSPNRLLRPVAVKNPD